MARCPYCKAPVTIDSTDKDEHTEVQKDVKGLIKKEVMYSCPHCECVLGFAYFVGGGFLNDRP